MEQYLTFELHHGTYGILVQQAKEVLENYPITAVPNMPQAMLGVINLRGDATPVMNLSLRLGLTFPKEQGVAHLIVVELAEQTQIALAVEQVKEVVLLEPEAILAPPKQGMNRLLSPSFIQGLVESEPGKMMILLNVEELFSFSSLSAQEALSRLKEDLLQLEAEESYPLEQQG